MPTIEELRAQTEALRVKRAEKSRIADDARELRELQEQVKLGEIEDAEGLLDRDIKAIFSSYDGAMIVVRKPSQVAYQRFSAKVLGGKNVTIRDLDDLIKTCLVYPDKAGFEKICESAPGMLDSVTEAIASIVGKAREDIEGK